MGSTSLWNVGLSDGPPVLVLALPPVPALVPGSLEQPRKGTIPAKIKPNTGAMPSRFMRRALLENRDAWSGGAPPVSIAEAAEDQLLMALAARFGCQSTSSAP